MSLEIERKFLVAERPGWLPTCAAERIEQGYLALAEGVEVRLRSADDRRLLTVKQGDGAVREEVEIGLDEAQFRALWPLAQPRRLAKTRYRVPLEAGLEAEIDAYEEGLEGLLVAEVEFGSEEASRDFSPPPWLGQEITGDPRYANRRLAVDGHPAA
ncbi:MAG: CYTH domain-containing protein [Solirubrobacterales bacterium]